MFLVYLLKNDNKTYIGYTNDFFKRWQQHNGYLSGGAKYTTKNEGLWQPICIVDGFVCKKEAMRCEWRLKRAKGYINRIKYINEYLSNKEKFTKKGNDIKSLNLNVFVTDEYKDFFSINTHELYWF